MKKEKEKEIKFQMSYADMTFEEVKSGLAFSINFIRKRGFATKRIRKFIRDAIKARFPMKEEGFEDFLRYYGK